MTIEQRVPNLEKMVVELLKSQLEERPQIKSFENSIKQMTAILPVVQELNRVEYGEIERRAINVIQAIIQSKLFLINRRGNRYQHFA